ncbi:adenylate/guanylate cyclase domain-containing protein [Vineibacter terrae]|uniref:adenylate/guanylate cyclase domain-containing protein n=1 Tax=Vineibacter terrae TaxID=2586908 RepID=UPI002E2FE736|nr:adenylate/guanylate cyclase domain-containing protein [Vineibacter terrae]HEX2888007.1 adenylate/guanylate cyclase domain-containing protein [Vineibacter terrae]
MPREQRRLAAIVSADVAGYSRLMGRDESGTLAALKALRRDVIDPKIAEHDGRIVKTTGDGLLLEFGSVVDAVRCMVDVQAAIAIGNADIPVERRIEFRIGVNIGDIIIEGDDIFGDGVNIAARLQQIAEPGGICVSDFVQQQVRDRLAVAFSDMGEQQVKNINRPLRVYSLTGRVDAADALAKAAALPARPVLPSGPSIAVLPFTNMSGDPEQDYFADGMVEDIITALSRFKEFLVIARNSTFIYKDQAVDIQEVARDLGVRYVLEGSVRKSGNRVRITGQLIDAATRAHIWADRFDGALDDIFELQDRITDSVVGALAPKLTAAEVERARCSPPANLDAYDYLLRALPWVIGNSAADASEAIHLLDDALRINPRYARAHALKALANAQVFRGAVDPGREDARLAGITHGRRALELADEDSTALAYGGFALLVLAQDLATARTALDKAVTLNPSQAMAYAYRSLVLSMAGEPEPAIKDATRALRLSPFDPANYLPQMALVVSNIWLDRFDEAVAWAHQAIRTAPPRYPMSYAWLIVAESARGNAAEARSQVENLARLLPGFGPETLARMFDVFPLPVRTKSLAYLQHAGLVPAEQQTPGTQE